MFGICCTFAAMMAALIILGAIVAAGVFLWLVDGRRKPAPQPGDDGQPEEAGAGGDEETAGDSACCGMHITCERDSLLASVSREIEYFDDEELDRFAGRESAGYTSAEADEFRSILLTLLPDDIAPWARSLQLRGIALPDDVREELLLIVSETRAARHTNNHS